MRILLFTSDLLTNQGLYPFDPQIVLQKLPQPLDRALTPPTTQISALNRTPKNQDAITAVLKTLNPYSLNHQTKLNKVIKAMNTMQADLLITRDSTRSLFRANINRGTRKKKRSSAGGYIPAFGRVLTEAEAIRHREDEARKLEIAPQKEAAEAKKLAVAARKADEEVRRRARRAEREEKRRVRDHEKAIKATEVNSRKGSEKR